MMKNAFRGMWVLVAALMLGLAGCANTGTKTGDYVDDSWITTKVKSDLVGTKGISSNNISVTTTKGVVTLTGTAPTAQESKKAADVARGVKGVTKVENDIRVQ
jgi:osmotically-inducible protein OsmY